MAQFCVYRLSPTSLVLDLHTDLIETGTRVVAPLVPLATGPRPFTRLEPIFDIGGTQYALHTAELAAIPARFVNRPAVADLRAHEDDIRRALDMVFSGF
jgi:toxin CcdB